VPLSSTAEHLLQADLSGFVVVLIPASSAVRFWI